MLVFAVVLADAAMVERVISMDMSEAAGQRYAGGPARHRVTGAPDSRDIEGMGGRFWYEAT